MCLTRIDPGLVVVAPLATLTVFAVTAIVTSVTTTHNACHEFQFGFGHLAVLIKIGPFETLEPTRCELVLINNAVITRGLCEVASAAVFATFPSPFVTGFAFRVPRFMESPRFVFGKRAIAISISRAEVRRDLRVNFVPRDAAIAIGVEVGKAFLHKAFAALVGPRAALRISKAGRHRRHQN